MALGVQVRHSKAYHLHPQHFTRRFARGPQFPLHGRRSALIKGNRRPRMQARQQIRQQAGQPAPPRATSLRPLGPAPPPPAGVRITVSSVSTSSRRMWFRNAARRALRSTRTTRDSGSASASGDARQAGAAAHIQQRGARLDGAQRRHRRQTVQQVVGNQPPPIGTDQPVHRIGRLDQRDEAHQPVTQLPVAAHIQPAQPIVEQLVIRQFRPPRHHGTQKCHALLQCAHGKRNRPHRPRSGGGPGVRTRLHHRATPCREEAPAHGDGAQDLGGARQNTPRKPATPRCGDAARTELERVQDGLGRIAAEEADLSAQVEVMKRHLKSMRPATAINVDAEQLLAQLQSLTGEPDTLKSDLDRLGTQQRADQELAALKRRMARGE